MLAVTDGVDVTVKLISYHSDHKAAVIASFLRQLAECLDVKDVKHNDIHRHTPPSSYSEHKQNIWELSVLLSH